MDFRSVRSLEKGRGISVHRRVYLTLLAAALISGFAVVGLTGCGRDVNGDEAADGGKQVVTLTILAASSLTDAFGELARTFEEQNPGTEVRTSFGASSEMLAQIQQGAPAHVFASADQENMDTAVKNGIVAGKPEIFVKNREVVMVPKDNPANIQSLRDVAKPN